MNNPGSSFFLQQLPFVMPLLLVCLGGFVVAAIFLGKNFNAAALVMAGTGLLIFATLGVMVGQYLLIHQGGPSSRQAMQVVAILGSLMRALATAVLIAAAFVGRSQPPAVQYPPAYPGQPFAK